MEFKKLKENKWKWISIVLIGLLVLFGVWSYAVVPLVVSHDNQVASAVVLFLVDQVTTNGYVQVSLGNGTLTLAPYQPQ